MDALDYAIYRNLSRDGLSRFWACRRLVDPRVTAREIADRVGLSEAGVRSRLAGLRERGLLRGTSVNVNPSLFGARVVFSEVPIRDPLEAEKLFRDLAVVDGVLFARDLMDEQDRKVRVYYVSDTPSATQRRTALLRRLSPNGLVRGPNPYWIPACDRELTPLDWRLLSVFRNSPDENLAGFASAAGISQKTTARRFGALLDSRACWWSHSSDSEEWPLALLLLTVQAEANAATLADEVARQVGSWLPVAADGFGVNPESPRRPVAGLVPVETPAALERGVRRLLAVKGVQAVQRTFGLGSSTYSQWVDEQLSTRVGPLP